MSYKLPLFVAAAFLGGYMLTRHILVITGIILLLAGSYTYFTKVKKTAEV